MSNKCVDPQTGKVMVNDYDGAGWHPADDSSYAPASHGPVVGHKSRGVDLAASEMRLAERKARIIREVEQEKRKARELAERERVALVMFHEEQTARLNARYLL